jgi:glycosyltransferase involved in cell wall biosynthesis
VLVGDGPDLGTAYRLSHELGIASLVDAVGEQEAVVPLLSAADVFLLPSAQESFGLAALEAMSCEVPVVASRVGGLPEVIEDGVTGFLHPPDDVEGMAESAVRVLTDDTLSRQIGLAASEVVHERFCSNRIVPMYEEYYQQVVAQPADL